MTAISHNPHYGKLKAAFFGEVTVAVLNKYHYGGTIPQGAINIMRGTPYGNPFAIGRDGDRGEVLAKYKKWLWDKIKGDQAYAGKIKDLYGHDLCCCCAPAPCHGEILDAAAKWLNTLEPKERE